MIVKVLGVDTEVPLQKGKELSLHIIDLSDRETEVSVAADSGVAGPVLVVVG